MSVGDLTEEGYGQCWSGKWERGGEEEGEFRH